MTQFNSSVNVNIKVDIDPDELEGYLLDMNRLQPAQVVNTSDHAEYVEYGTGPIRHGMQGSTVLQDNLDEWAKEKLHITDDRARKRFVYMLSKKIVNQGLSPMPYFRPAVIQVIDHIQDWFDRGYSIYDIGLEIVNEAQLNLIADNRNYHWDIFTKFFVQTIARTNTQQAPDLTPEEMMELARRIWEDGHTF